MSEIIIDVDWLKKHFNVKKDADLSTFVGAAVATIRGWKKRGVPNEIQKEMMQYALQEKSLNGIFQKIEESAVDASSVSPEDQEFLQLFKDYAPSKYIDKVKKDLEDFKKQIDGGN